MDRNQIFKPYQEKIEDLFPLSNNYTFLAGAGVSVDPPANLPSAAMISRTLIECFCLKEEVENLLRFDSLRYEMVVERFALSIDNSLMFMDYFNEINTPNLIHIFLGNMVLKGNFIVTTNFDYMIEFAVISRVLLRELAPIMEDLKSAKNPEDIAKLKVLEKREEAIRSIKPIITKNDYLDYDDPYDIITNQGLYPIYKIHGSKTNIVTSEDTIDSLVTTMWALGKDREEGKTFSIEPYKEPAMNNLMKDRILCIMGYSGQDDFDIGPLLKRYRYISRLIWIEHAFNDKPEIFKVNMDIDSSFPLLSPSERLLAEIAFMHDYEVFQIKANTGDFIEDSLWSRFLSEIELPDLNYYDDNQDIKPPDFKKWIIQTIGDVGEVKKCRFTSFLYEILGQVEDAIRVAKKGLTLVPEDGALEHTNLTIFFHERIAKMSSLKFDFNTSLSHYERCLELSKEIGHESKEIYFTDLIGTIYHQLGNPDKALVKYNVALKLNEKLGNDQRRASLLSNIAQIHLDNEDYEMTLQSFQASLKIYHEMGHLGSKAACLINIGSVYFQLEDYQNALEVIEDALKIVKQNVNFPLQMKCLNDIGVIYSSMGNLDTALQKFEEAKEVRFNMGLKEDGIYYHHVGHIFYDKRDFDKALGYFKKGLIIAERQNNKDLIPSLLDGVATTLDSKKQYNEAKKYYLKALNLYKGLGYKYGAKIVKDKLATLEEKIKKTQK